jgi:hypothetical protein
MTTTVVQVDTVQVVYSDNTRTPLIGPDSPDGEQTFSPWKWDERMWTDKYFENSERAIPVLGDQDARGIPEEYWQSGVGSDKIDLEVLKAISLRQESQERWTTRIRHGDYYKFHKPRHLFADRSQVQFVDNTENESGRNVLQLDEMPRYGSPIMALMWTRNELSEPMLFRSIQKRMQFTGVFDEDGEQDTQDDDGDIIWGSVDTSRKEFVVQWTGTKTTPPKLYFNQDHTFLVGRTSVSDEDDLGYCDFLGEGKGVDEDQALFTKYFPILDDSNLKLYKLVGAVITEMQRWTPRYAGPPDPEYMIDTNRGEITFPTEVNGETTNIVAPDYGVEIYAVYRPTIEVEYEPEECNNFLTAPYINLSPVATSTNKGFIYLTERELRVAYLVLSADAPLITEDTYGPLYLGSDYCFLVATAYNNNGQPVPGVEVSFYLDSADDGRLNGATALVGSEITATTDDEGKARVVYSSPRSIESVGQYLAHVNGVDTQSELTLIHTNGITSDDLDSLYVYQVFNDDTMQLWYDDGDAGTGEEPGYGGRKVVLYRRTIAAELGGGDEEPSTNRFPGDSDDLHPRTGEDGGSTDVWMPLRPVEMTGSTLIFKDELGVLVDLPWTEAPTGNPGNLVAYWISAGKQVPAHAKCFSFLYNEWIDSNDIEFRVSVPEYLTGIYVTEDSKEIPYGFRLYDDHSPASGLDGATFLSIHPAAGKWPIIWDGSPLSEIELPDTFIDSNVLGHEFTVTVS